MDAVLNVINKFERKITGKGAVGEEKRLTLFISNEDLGDIVRILESLEKSDLLIVGATETVRHEIIKKQEGRIFGVMMPPITASLIASMVSSFIKLLVSSFINAMTGKGVMAAGKGKDFYFY